MTNKERARQWLTTAAHVECYAHMENRRTPGPDMADHERDVDSLALLLDEVRSLALREAAGACMLVVSAGAYPTPEWTAATHGCADAIIEIEKGA